MFIPIVLFIVAAQFAVANAQCFALNTTTTVNSDGSVSTVCNYGDVTMQLNTTRLADNCLQCSCTGHGLFCCGYGSRLVYYDFSAIMGGRCKLIQINCHSFLVRASNEVLDCYSGRPIGYMIRRSAVENEPGINGI